jgi:hypothetical protein
MKKIFLTSGLAICIASSAFAVAHDIDTDNHLVPINNDIAANTNATCQEPTLGNYTGPTTFYAKWTANPYTITYYPGVAKTPLYSHNVQGTATVQNVEFDAPVTTKNNSAADLTGGAWSQTGYTFAGWRSDHDLLTNASTPALSNDNTEGGARVYGAGVSNINATPLTYKVPGNTKMYAIWTPNKSGIITLDSSIYPGNNHTETAKYTTSTGVTAVSPSSVVSIYETGLWPSNVEQMTSQNKISSFTAPEKVGYTFKGFYEEDGETQVITNTGAIVNDNALTSVSTEGQNSTWYAHWTVNSHTITYTCGEVPAGAPSGTAFTSQTAPTYSYPNNGSGLPYDSTFTLATTAGDGCVLQGYHFTGWVCDHNLTSGATTNTPYAGTQVGNNVNSFSVSATGTFKVDDDVICKAQWAANTITTNWNANGGTAVGGGTYSQGDQAGSCTYDDVIHMGAVPERTGYTFKGWSTTQTVVP